MRRSDVGRAARTLTIMTLRHAPFAKKAKGCGTRKTEFKFNGWRRFFDYGRPMMCTCAYGDPAHMM